MRSTSVTLSPEPSPSLPKPWKLHGSRPRTTAEVDHDIEQQLRTSYVIQGECWIWIGQHWSNGYGRLARHRKDSRYSARAHIASYQFHVGSVDELFICHTCDFKDCMNPRHLWRGTNSDNQQDAIAKGVFERLWTPERREEASKRNAGAGNPMYGKRGKDAPCYGRTGAQHPMFGNHHTEDAKKKISTSLRRRHA